MNLKKTQKQTNRTLYECRRISLKKYVFLRNPILNFWVFHEYVPPNVLFSSWTVLKEDKHNVNDTHKIQKKREENKINS